MPIVVSTVFESYREVNLIQEWSMGESVEVGFVPDEKNVVTACGSVEFGRHTRHLHQQHFLQRLHKHRD